VLSNFFASVSLEWNADLVLSGFEMQLLFTMFSQIFSIFFSIATAKVYPGWETWLLPAVG
jgi:hypothetical protein